MDLASNTRRKAFFPASKSELFTADSKTPAIWIQTVIAAQSYVGVGGNLNPFQPNVLAYPYQLDKPSPFPFEGCNVECFIFLKFIRPFSYPLTKH